MGYPLRYLGTGTAQEIDGVIIPGRCTVEVTIRTLQQQLLIRPDPKANEVLLGCFGRVYHRYPTLNLHVLNALSDHIQFLATPDSTAVLSSFMRDFLSMLAKSLNWLRGREGKFWERRFRSIPTADEAAIEDRFAYILTQGTKENLVASARDWPGVHCIDALLGGPQLVGRWRDRSAEYEINRRHERRNERARAAGRAVSERAPRHHQVVREYPIELVPLPHWSGLRPGQLRARVAAILHNDDRLTQERHQRCGTRPLGVRRILATSPFAYAEEPKKSPAPLCHAGNKAVRDAFRKAYRLFVDGVRAASAKLSVLASPLGLPVCATTPPLRGQAVRGELFAPGFHLVATFAAETQQATGPPRDVS